MKIVKLRDNIWINPDRVLFVRHDAAKLLTRVHFGLGEDESITVSATPDEVIKLLTEAV